MTDQRPFEADVVLQDGSLVHLRPIRPDDRYLLTDFLKRLSPETLYLRFLRAMGHPETEVSWLLPQDGGFGLLALREGRVVGHAAYTRTGEGKAGLGVIVADEMQGRGLGTLLLGQLTQAAAAAGITVMDALVAPHNQRMLRVLRDLGFPTELKSESGFVRAIFPTSLTPEAIAQFERREAVAAAAALRSFFRPRGVAVVGASRERGTIGGELFHNLLASGFQGAVYPVNSRAGVVQSVVAYPSVLECPGPVDLAVIAVPAPAVSSVARACALKGVRALAVISAGFAEAGGEGIRL